MAGRRRRRTLRDVNSIVKLPTTRTRLLSRLPRSAIPSSSGLGLPAGAAPTATSTSSTGIVSPITATKRWYKSITATSDDGSCEITVERDLQLDCTDGAGNALQIKIPEGVTKQEIT